MTRLPRLAAATAALALGVAGALAGPAQAHGSRSPISTTPTTLADGLLTPLRAAVAPDGTVYFTENYAGELLRVRPGEDPEVVYTDPDGYEVGGVSVAGRSVVFTVTQHDPANPQANLDSWLKVLTPSGQAVTVADLYDHETTDNPDEVNTYGFRSLDPTCAEQWPAALGPVSYPGGVDSHPYATYQSRGVTYVADAGANDVLAVSPQGTVRTVATLPAIPYRITSAALDLLSLPDCFLGSVYWFEPVPTDVEMGGHDLYLSSLPGGPEGSDLGGRGSIFSVDPLRHRAWPVVRGLVEPTGIAVAPDGLYVSQLYGDEISKVTFGRYGAHTTTVASVTNPGEVEWTPSGLVATANVLAGSDGASAPAGELVFFPTHRSHHGHQTHKSEGSHRSHGSKESKGDQSHHGHRSGHRR